MYKVCNRKKQSYLSKFAHGLCFRGLTNEELSAELKKRYDSFLELKVGDVIKGIVINRFPEGFQVRLNQENLCGTVLAKNIPPSMRIVQHQKIRVVITDKGINPKSGKAFVHLNILDVC